MSEPASAAQVSAEQRGKVLWVTINRPEKRNSLSRETLKQLQDCFEGHADNTDICAAVLRGAGEKSFAAGGDLKDLASVRKLDEAADMARKGKAALTAVRDFPVPVVAGVNGDALGGGAELATACDFRVLAAHARIGFVQGRLNITTAWGGGVDLLRLLGTSRGLRLLSHADVLSSEAAMAIGLADMVAEEGTPLDEVIEAFLAPIVQQVPRVLRAFKRMAIETRNGAPRAALLDMETDLFSTAWVHHDHWAAAERILTKTKNDSKG